MKTENDEKKSNTDRRLNAAVRRFYCPNCNKMKNGKKLTTGYRYEWICGTCGEFVSGMTRKDYERAVQYERAEDNALDPENA